MARRARAVPRAYGYAVQRLKTDCLASRCGRMRPVSWSWRSAGCIEPEPAHPVRIRPLPDTRLYHDMARGHLQRHGHPLSASIVMDEHESLWRIVRSCC